MNARISRRDALGSLSATLLPGAAWAAQEEDGANSDPSRMELTAVVLPLANGQALVTYLFCVVVIQFRDTGSAFYFRENHFQLRDAIVRIAARAPIPVGQTPGSFDRVAITRVVLRAVQAVRPSAQVLRVTVTNPEMMRR